MKKVNPVQMLLSIKRSCHHFIKHNKKIAVVFAALILNAMCFTGVLAYFISTDVANNTFVVADNTSSIIEEFPDGEIPTDGERVLRKKVAIENTGPVPTAVRVSVNFSTSDMKNITTLDINTDDWEYNEEDEYYYYKQILDANDVTAPLFEKVEFSSEATEAQMKDFSIYICSETRSADIDTSYEDVVW